MKCESVKQTSIGAVSCTREDEHIEHFSAHYNLHWTDKANAMEVCTSVNPGGEHHCGLAKGHKGYHVVPTTGYTWTDPMPPVSDRATRDPALGASANWFSIDRESELALAETCAEGDVRYGLDNWRKGIPVSNLLNHAFEHLSKLKEGDSSEPHIAHAMWNLGKVLWMAKHKPEMVDVPMVRKALGMKESE